MNAPIIEVEHIYKKFPTSLKRGLYYGFVDTLQTMCGLKPCREKLRHKEFWALKDISFSVEQGESVGLIGCNGSGKTTLLRLISGIYPPSRGTMKIRGNIGSLIAVGAGFHPHMTGKENIFLNGSIHGMSRKTIQQRMDKIIAFSEIGSFLDSPVVTYSSGMGLRLAFAIAIHCDIDILLADEILAVGDDAFRKKCLDKMTELQRGGVSLILVSHFSQQIKKHCDSIVLLHKGVQRFCGDITEGFELYDELLRGDRRANQNTGDAAEYFHVPDVHTTPEPADGRCSIPAGGPFSIQLRYFSDKDYNKINVKLVFHVPSLVQDNEKELTGEQVGQCFAIQKGSGVITVTASGMPFNGIEALVGVEVWDAERNVCLYVKRNIRLYTQEGFNQKGPLTFPVQFSVKKE